MPTVLGIPLIGFVQMLIGALIVLFIIIKFLTRPKKYRDGEYIIGNVHVIVGDGTELEHQNVYIKNGAIVSISAEPINRKRVQYIDGKGKTLMPGLIDCHVHTTGLNVHNDAESETFLTETVPEIFQERVLPYGITTIKDLCSPRHFIFRLREKLQSGEITGPQLLAVGPNFTAPNGHPANTLGGTNPWLRSELAIEVQTADEVTEGVHALKEEGTDFLKITYQGGEYWYFDQKLQINKLDKSLMQQIIQEGKTQGLQTTAHVFRYDDVYELLEAGIYGIEHGILDRNIEQEDKIVALWKESGTHFVPTVNAMTYEKDPNRLTHSLHNLKVLYDAGIPVALGTDTMLETMNGDTVHKELAYYVQAGLTPMQAIITATSAAAAHLGLTDRGTVTPGKRADLVLLDENPVENIENIQFINRVFLNGKTVHAAAKIQSYDIPDYTFPKTCLSYKGTDNSESRKLETNTSEKKIIHTMYQKDTAYVTETFTLEPNLSAMNWHYSRPEDSTDLTGVRENGSIHLTGTFKGKKQDKKLKIGDGLWYQLMDQALPAFVKSAQEEILFYSIGTGNNRGAMGLGEFAAKKLETETITVNGQSFDCVKVSLVLTMFSWAWTGLYWYDKKTGILIQSGEKKGNSVKIHDTLQ